MTERQTREMWCIFTGLLFHYFIFHQLSEQEPQYLRASWLYSAGQAAGLFRPVGAEMGYQV